MSEDIPYLMPEDANHAYLVGIIFGTLAKSTEKFEPEIVCDARGNFTCQIIIQRDSGPYTITIEKGNTA